VLLLLAVVVALGAYIVLANRARHKVAHPERLTVSELRRRAGLNVDREIASDLLQRNTFVFVSLSFGRTFDQRLEDADGIELGSSLQIPRSNVEVEIRDLNDTRIAKMIRQRGLFASSLSVLDGSRVPVGTVRWEGRRQYAIRDVLGRTLGTIRRTSRGSDLDYTIEDATGAQVGAISDLAHLAARLGLDPPLETRRRRFSRPNEHVLEITAPVTHDLRLLMLGSAAGLYLTLQGPLSEPADD
jgi:hypothetical protein